jgi:hypothetical protein
MRPGEALVVLLSPLFFIAQMGRRFRNWAGKQITGLMNGQG